MKLLSKKMTAILMTAVISASVFSAAFAEDAAGTAETSADGLSGQTCQSYLTGTTVPVEVGRQRPIALMFNNIYDAVPQCGIENCGVLVEAEVEGLITRICGIMEDYRDAPRIGSIRSARNYFYYFARQFNAVYVHYGEAAYALPLLRLDSTLELDGLEPEGDVTFYRADDRKAPHNAFTNYDMLHAGIEYKGYDMNYPDGYEGVFSFASTFDPTTNEGGADATVVKPGYDYNDAEFDYNAEDGLYYRSQFNESQIDENSGSQLTCRNIILQYCSSTPFDDNGYLWTDVTGSGTGKYITNGKCIDITWSHDYAQEDTDFIVDIEAPNITVPVYAADFEPTHYYDADGNEIKMNPGKTWICLVRSQAADQVVIQ